MWNEIYEHPACSQQRSSQGLKQICLNDRTRVSNSQVQKSYLKFKKLPVLTEKNPSFLVWLKCFLNLHYLQTVSQGTAKLIFSRLIFFFYFYSVVILSADATHLPLLTPLSGD